MTENPCLGPGDDLVGEITLALEAGFALLTEKLRLLPGAGGLWLNVEAGVFDVRRGFKLNRDSLTKATCC